MELTGAKPARIMSIDALRGFDMLMIIFADRFFYHLGQAAPNPVTETLATHFNHPEWYGFHFYDIIMPLFLFMVGAVIPYSLHRRVDQGGTRTFYLHLLRRFAILFFLGWIVQGNLLALDASKFHIFSNTLQAIAVGYLFASIIYLNLQKKWWYLLFALCLVAYAALLAFPTLPGGAQSVILPGKSFVLYVDQLVFGRFDDGLEYTWLLTGLGFTATTLSGMFAGELIRSESDKVKVFKYLALIGILAVVTGLVWDIWHPIVKKVWTSSFVLFSSGICYLMLALFYWVIDIKGWQKWAFWLRVIGMNAIVAYVASHVLNFPDISAYIMFGLEQYTGGFYPVITSIGGFGLLYLVLWYMYRKGTFVKV